MVVGMVSFSGSSGSSGSSGGSFNDSYYGSVTLLPPRFLRGEKVPQADEGGVGPERGPRKPASMPRSGELNRIRADVISRWSGAAAVLLAMALPFSACRTTHPANEVPLAAGTPLTAVHAIRSLMRIRVTNGNRSFSFRAQMLVEPATEKIAMIVYTPIGTSALTLFAEGDHVTFLNHMNHTTWQGRAAEFSAATGLFGGTLPAAWALALVGYPASLGDLAVESDPPGVVPATRVILIRGNQKVEVTNLEVLATDAAPVAPAIPRNYRCCVAPEMR